MSKANRKRQYEKTKDNKTNHLCSAALRREFEGENPEELATREEKEKKINERKLAEDEIVDMDEEAQSKILEGYGVTNIPRSESKRVKKILEMQNV